MTFHLDRGVILRHEFTPEGYLNCYARIARTGKLRYFNSDGSERIENVSSEVLFDKKSMKSFKGKPVTLLHPPVKVDSENARLYQRGLTTPYTVIDGDFLGIVLTITDKETIEAVSKGDARQISCGYDAEISLRDDGEYDQLSRIGNHVAVVPKGRAGSEVSIKLDNEDSQLWISEYFEIDSDEPLKPEILDKLKTDNSSKTIKTPNKRRMKKFLLNGITFETEDVDLVEQVKIVNSKLDSYEKLTGEFDKFKSDSVAESEAIKSENIQLKKDKETLEGKFDALTDEVKDLKDKLVEAEKVSETKTDSAQISSEVKARLDMWSIITPYFKDNSEFKIDSSLSEMEIQKYALTLRNPDLKLDGKSSEYITGRFDALTWNTASESGAKVDSILEGISESRKDGAFELSSLDQAMNEYRKSLEGAWQSK